MRVYHLNCTTLHTNLPYPGVTHCLLVESNEGLVLVDSGFGLADYTRPSSHVRWFTAVNGIPCDVEETAIRQVAGLGFKPEEVRHIVLTHLHLDHAGGIVDFPWAQVHVFEPELAAAMKPQRFSWLERVGYVAEHWVHGPNWAVHSSTGETWLGLDSVSVLAEASCQVLLIPLVGHSRGHCGVAVRAADRWYLHCGDAYVRDTQVDSQDPRSPFPGWVRPFARRLFPEEPLNRLQRFRQDHGNEVEILCSHDSHPFSRLHAMSH